MTAEHITITDFTAMPGILSADRCVYAFPIVGDKPSWQILVSIVDATGNKVAIVDSYFDPSVPLPAGLIARIDVQVITVLGNTRQSSPTFVRVGKNLGKRNQTNAFCQALRDALSKHNRQAKYSAPREATKPLFFPMLAKIWDAKKATYPAWVSPKLDGLRAMITNVDGEIRVFSRTLKEYPPITVMVNDLSPMLLVHPEIYLDGEIYCHGTKLQDIASMAKVEGRGENLKYYVYDVLCVDGGAIKPLLFAERLALLRQLFAEYGLPTTHVELVPHTMIGDAQEMQKIYANYLADNYEGVIVRFNAEYESRGRNYHSSRMVKVKPTLDAEYKLVDWTVAKNGKAAGALMLQFETAKKLTFWVTPSLPEDQRKELAKNMADEWPKWANKYLTVYYAELSADGVPLQGRTKMLGRQD